MNENSNGEASLKISANQCLSIFEVVNGMVNFISKNVFDGVTRITAPIIGVELKMTGHTLFYIGQKIGCVPCRALADKPAKDQLGAPVNRKESELLSAIFVPVIRVHLLAENIGVYFIGAYKIRRHIANAGIQKLRRLLSGGFQDVQNRFLMQSGDSGNGADVQHGPVLANRFSGFARGQTAEAVPALVTITVTPLKQGVNEMAFDVVLFSHGDPLKF